MRRILAVCAIFLAVAGIASAQKGSATNGYYPPNYHGDMWSGVVISANEQSREIVLEYRKGDKTERFVGVPTKDYQIHEHNGPTRPLKMSDIPVGRAVKVWYTEDTVKVDGKKVKVNTIFEIDAVANAAKSYWVYMAF